MHELPADAHVDACLLLESVGAKRQPTGLLMTRFVLEATQWYQRYLNAKALTNHVPAWMNRLGSDSTKAATFAGYAAYVPGLARGRLLDDITTSKAANDTTHIVVASTDKSVVSPVDVNDQFAIALEERTKANVSRRIYLDEAHGVIDAPVKLVELLEGTFSPR